MIDLEKQYERLLDQLEKEVQELYWLYNFFFVAEAALIGYSFRRLPDHNFYLAAVGLLLGYLWFLVFNKQRLWRDRWIKNLTFIEETLAIPEQFRFFEKIKHDSITRWVKALLPFGSSGIAKSLVAVPVFSILIWLWYLLANASY